MTKTSSRRTIADDKHPFKRFQERVKNLLCVPKGEVDKAPKAHEEQRKQGERN